ncbi:hypothetical protein MHI57_20260 [Cytobacillus sp. FSL K6-0129]|uniref:hypothetical protein n=1 Tax=Cytobacillus sp. FSL K6-0129 TaxID=2921421 RepID=UPI0030FB5FD6
MEWLKEIKVADGIQIIIALIAMTSAIAALCTARQGAKSLKLSKQQRQDTIKPKIIVEEVAYGLEISNGELGRFYKDRQFLDRLELPIRNIGLHFATDININWSIDQDKIIEFIQKNQIDSKFIDDYRDQQLIVPESSYYYYYKPFTSFESYLGDNKVSRIQIPYEFTFLMRCVVFLILENDLRPEEYEEYTSFTMEVSYKNILGDKLKEEIFDIEMKIDIETRSIADGKLETGEIRAIFRNKNAGVKTETI